jgi:hypothetical protein
MASTPTLWKYAAVHEHDFTTLLEAFANVQVRSRMRASLARTDRRGAGQRNDGTRDVRQLERLQRRLVGPAGERPLACGHVCRDHRARRVHLPVRWDIPVRSHRCGALVLNLSKSIESPQARALAGVVCASVITALLVV